MCIRDRNYTVHVNFNKTKFRTLLNPTLLKQSVVVRGWTPPPCSTDHILSTQKRDTVFTGCRRVGISFVTVDVLQVWQNDPLVI